MTNAPTASTPAPAGSAMSDITRLARVLFSPGAVFAELQERPSFWTPWLAVSVVTIVLNWLQRPFQARVQQIILEQRGITVPPPSMVKALIGVVLTPVGVLLLAVISAAILYGLVAAFGGETSYKKMMTVVIYAWPIVLIQQTVTAIVLTMRGVDKITGPWDAFVSLGADVFLPAETTMSNFMRIVLAGIGPLQIWGLTIIAIGAMVMGRAGKGQAWTVATIHYLIGLCAGAGIAAFGMKMMGAS